MTAHRLVPGRAAAVRQFETDLRQAGIAMVSRGLELLDEGRLEPTDPLEQWCVRLARSQIAVNLTTGLPAYMRGASTLTARLHLVADTDSQVVSIAPTQGGNWEVAVGGSRTVTNTRRHAARIAIGKVLPGRSASDVGALADHLDEAMDAVLDTTVGALREWATKQARNVS